LSHRRAEALKAYLRRHGKPVAFYSDKHSIFRVSNENAVSGNGMTQFGRALSELNIEILCANTSQAKGRVERAHHTLQDRLVKELAQLAQNRRPTIIESMA
jgi:glucokinase